MLDLTEELDLVLKASLDGQRLQEAAHQSRRIRFTILTAWVAQIQLHCQEGLHTCRLCWDKFQKQCNSFRYITYDFGSQRPTQKKLGDSNQ